jgi:hypothetical protein
MKTGKISTIEGLYEKNILALEAGEFAAACSLRKEGLRLDRQPDPG